MLYKKALQYLNEIPELSNSNWDLQKITNVFSKIGKLSSINIQIVGTNGKGTTAAFLQKVLYQHGYSVGLFTSPHLQKIEERIVCNDRLISNKEFAEICLSVKNRFSTMQLSYFEKIAIIAYIFFQKKELNFVVWEAGLGGRLDATTAVDQDLVVFTPIAKDHCEYLGNTIQEIVHEKGWTMQKTPKVFSLPQSSIVKKYLLLNAKKYNREIVFTPKVENAQLVETGSSFSYKNHTFISKMYGEHYAQNATSSLAVAESILCDFNMKKAAKAISSVMWPGRLEFKNYKTYGQFLFSCAHNIHSIQRDLMEVKKFLKKGLLSKDTYVIFAITRGRPAIEHIEEIRKIFCNIIITKANKYHPIPLVLKEKYQNTCSFTETVSEVLTLLKQKNIVSTFVIGSIYLIGQFWDILDE